MTISYYGPRTPDGLNSTGVVSSLNSSSTPLSGSATFTGTWEDVSGYDSITASVLTDASGTLKVQFSPDGTNIDSTVSVSIDSGSGQLKRLTVLRKYYRVVVENGSAAQSYMRLQSLKGEKQLLTSTLRSTVNKDADSIISRPTVDQDEIVLGRRGGVSSWNKFGYRDTLQAASGEETIWAATGNFTPMTSADTFDIAYDGTAGGSTDGSGTTGATELTFYYIDSNGLPAISSHTLGTDGTDTTSFSGLGINRCVVSASGSSNYNVSDITITDTSGATIQAFIPSQGSVTQQCIFFVGSNHTCSFKYLEFNVNKLSGSNPKVTVKGYVFNRNVETRYEVYRHIIDAQSETTVSITDPVGFRLNAQDILYFVADTDQNNTVITMRFSLNQYEN